MADLGFSPSHLRTLIQREVRHRNSDYSIADEIAVLSRAQKIQKAFLLTSSIIQFLSAILLTLISVDTLPYANPYLIFWPSFITSLSSSLAGGFYVTIIWLNANLIKNITLIRVGLVVNIVSQVLFTLWIGWMVHLARSSGEVRPIRNALEQHFFALSVLAPTAIVFSAVTSWFLTGFLVFKLIRHRLR